MDTKKSVPVNAGKLTQGQKTNPHNVSYLQNIISVKFIQVEILLAAVSCFNLSKTPRQFLKHLLQNSRFQGYWFLPTFGLKGGVYG